MGKSLVARLVGIGVAIAVALGVYYFSSRGEEKAEQAKAPDVGECVYFEKDGTNDEAVEVGCGDAKASHKVVGDAGSCGANETGYQVSRAGSDAFVDLCLVINAAKGDCFDLATEGKVDCAATKGQPQVQKVASVGKAGGACATPGQPFEYAEQDTLICFVPNG
ncbi:hypothetical protein L615_000600000120 [Nocardioides sp. J9]|uniref:LppU/SCO3897 family protein n=1 Tax=unclassified Nocardioides TaxID=2615069 RepID=UPI00048D6957|nr:MULTISPECIES: hypothetical protein [unclassified Nocardioides]TWG93899.1 hypothetical protein L615_000600000120 [Nocardioides sp. J9]